jgi:hypothetical protein
MLLATVAILRSIIDSSSSPAALDISAMAAAFMTTAVDGSLEPAAEIATSPILDSSSTELR